MANGPIPFYKRRSVQVLLGLVVSVACLWFSMKDLLADEAQRQKLWTEFRTADYSTLPMIWGVLFVFYWLKCWRWAMLLSPVGKYAPLKDLFPPMMIGFALNNVLPAHLGDVARVFLFAKQAGVKKTPILSTVVLERVFDIIAILCFLGFGLLFVNGLDSSIRNSAMVFGVCSFCGVIGALAYVLWTPQIVKMAEWGMKIVPILPVGIRSKILGMMETGAEGLSSLKSMRSFLGIMLTSLVQWGLNGSLVYFSLWSFGIHVDSPLLVSCIVMGAVAFGVTVPSTPGYFGVIQACFTLALNLFVAADDMGAKVFAASVYYHLAQYIPVTIVGLMYLFLKGFRVSDLQSAGVKEVPQ